MTGGCYTMFHVWLVALAAALTATIVTRWLDRR